MGTFYEFKMNQTIFTDAGLVFSTTYLRPANMSGAPHSPDNRIIECSSRFYRMLARLSLFKKSLHKIHDLWSWRFGLKNLFNPHLL